MVPWTEPAGNAMKFSCLRLAFAFGLPDDALDNGATPSRQGESCVPGHSPDGILVSAGEADKDGFKALMLPTHWKGNGNNGCHDGRSFRPLRRGWSVLLLLRHGFLLRPPGAARLASMEKEQNKVKPGATYGDTRNVSFLDGTLMQGTAAGLLSGPPPSPPSSLAGMTDKHWIPGALELVLGIPVCVPASALRPNRHALRRVYHAKPARPIPVEGVSLRLPFIGSSSPCRERTPPAA